MTKKLLAVLLAVIMVLGTMVSCGSSDSTPTTQPSSEKTDNSESEKGQEQEPSKQDSEKINVGGLELPLCDEKQELTVFAVWNNNFVENPNEIKGVQQLEELTNVHINWITVDNSNLLDKYNTMIASGNYPDIIYAASHDYPGGAEKGIEDGIFIDPDEYIRTCMPNYMALLDATEQGRKEATADNKKLQNVRIIVGQDLTVESEGSYFGMAYRKDLFDKMGLELPETVDGWHDVLVKCKEAGMTYPFVPDQYGGSYMMLSYGGVANDAGRYYLQLDPKDTSKVVSSAMLDGFGEYLETMRKWYNEGLINTNFTAGDFLVTGDYSNFNDDQTMLFNRIVSTFGEDAMYNMGLISNEQAFMQPIMPPKVNPEDETYISFRRVIAKDPIYVTTSCKNPELAFKWLDYLWSTPGSYMLWYGVEGESYEIGPDGTPTFTDAMIHNPDGRTIAQAASVYGLNVGNNCWIGKHDISSSWKISEISNNGRTIETDSVAIWSPDVTNVYLPEAISLTDQEGVEAAPLVTALNTMIQEYMVGYILGTDGTPFEEFKKKLEQFGINEVIDIYQAAYTRYLER